jgi:dynein heavy chain
LIPKKEDGGSISLRHLEHLYVFSVMWSLGALLELDDRFKLEHFIRETFDHDLPEVEESQTMFEFVVNDAGKFAQNGRSNFLEINLVWFSFLETIATGKKSVI